MSHLFFVGHCILCYRKKWCGLFSQKFMFVCFFLPEINKGTFSQEVFSAPCQLDGKRENLWPCKMKMLLPWELLILLSLKECLAGEMSRQVSFQDTPDIHTSVTGGRQPFFFLLCLAFRFITRGVRAAAEGIVTLIALASL